MEKITCQSCYGRGEVETHSGDSEVGYTYFNTECRSCQGKGVRYYEWIECTSCVRNEYHPELRSDCSYCKGSGRVTSPYGVLWE